MKTTHTIESSAEFLDLVSHQASCLPADHPHYPGERPLDKYPAVTGTLQVNGRATVNGAKVRLVDDPSFEFVAPLYNFMAELGKRVGLPDKLFAAKPASRGPAVVEDEEEDPLPASVDLALLDTRDKTLAAAGHFGDTDDRDLSAREFLTNVAFLYDMEPVDYDSWTALAEAIREYKKGGSESWYIHSSVKNDHSRQELVRLLRDLRLPKVSSPFQATVTVAAPSVKKQPSAKTVTMAEALGSLRKRKKAQDDLTEAGVNFDIPWQEEDEDEGEEEGSLVG